MKRRFDPGVFLLSLMLSVLLWVVVQGQLGAKTIHFQVPLTQINLENGLHWNKDFDSVTVETVVTQDQKDWIDQNKDQFSAVVDLNGLSPGQLTVPVKLRHPANEDITFQVKPRRIHVTIERFTERKIPVTVRLKGELPENLVWVGETVKPRTVSVTGPKDLLDEAIVRVDVDKANFQKNMQMLPQVQVVDKSGQPLTELSAARDVVTVTPIVESVKSVPLAAIRFTGNLAPGYKLGVFQLPNIRIRGPEAILERVRSIRVAPLHIDGLSVTTILRAVPQLPDGVSLYEGKTIDVQVPVETADTLPASSGPAGRTSSRSKGNTLP